MPNRGGLRRRLGRTFLLQALFISIAAVVGVYLAAFAIEELLIKRALEEEAVYYWSRWEQNPVSPLPDTRNLTGFMQVDGDDSTIPASMENLATGFHHLPTQADFSVVYVTEHEGASLFLIFDGERVDKLALYFGLMPLMATLMVAYLVTWLAYRASKRAVSPIIALAREVHDYDPTGSQHLPFQPTAPPGEADEEVLALSEALNRLSGRVIDFVERERMFTRDASHELRSPLTVIKMATELLLRESTLSANTVKSVDRIKRAASDMEELTEVFLLLARESESAFATEQISVNDVVQGELDRASVLLEGKPIEVSTVATHQVTLTTSARVLSVLIGNLIRNAFNYTDTGKVEILIEANRFVIEDSGIGIPKEQIKEVFKPYVRGNGSRRSGHGVGLTIVKRLSERFGWPISIDSQPDRGTCIVVELLNAKSEKIESQAHMK
jgi:signal transduction histidine kinase